MAVATEEHCAALARLGYPFFALKVKPKIEAGDRCILYRSGKRGGFIGDFEFVGAAVPDSIVLGDYRKFTFKMPWRAIALSDEAPTAIGPLVKDLQFIKNKGMYSMSVCPYGPHSERSRPPITSV